MQPPFSRPDFSHSKPAQSPEDLVLRLRNGSDSAACQLFDLFGEHLLIILRRRFHPSLSRRLDPEDILQSAFGSFIRVVSKETWDSTGPEGQVWCILVAITMNKLKAKIRFHSAGKRAVNREVFNLQSICSADLQAAETIFFDELNWLIQQATDRHKQIIELFIAGQSEEEIAATCQCSQRTVQRAISEIFENLQARLND